MGKMQNIERGKKEIDGGKSREQIRVNKRGGARPLVFRPSKNKENENEKEKDIRESV